MIIVRILFYSFLTSNVKQSPPSRIKPTSTFLAFATAFRKESNCPVRPLCSCAWQYGCYRSPDIEGLQRIYIIPPLKKMMHIFFSKNRPCVSYSPMSTIFSTFSHSNGALVSSDEHRAIEVRPSDSTMLQISASRSNRLLMYWEQRTSAEALALGTSAVVPFPSRLYWSWDREPGALDATRARAPGLVRRTK